MTQVNYPQVRKIKGLAKEKEIKMLPFYVEGDSELVSEIAFRILLHIRNKFGYTPYQLPVEIYIFWQNPSIIDFRKEEVRKRDCFFHPQLNTNPIMERDLSSGNRTYLSKAYSWDR